MKMEFEIIENYNVIEFEHGKVLESMSFAMSAWWSDTLYYHPTSTSSIVHHTFTSANRNIEF